MTDPTQPADPQPSRRDVLIKGAVASLAFAGSWSREGIALASVPGVARGETPGVEEGPFWVDSQLQRVDVRTDTSTGTTYAGVPLYLGLTISQLKDTAPYTISPLVGARVDIWSCDAQGVYSDESSESTSGENFLRGYQLTNAHGVVNFLTVYPGWYSGRTPHVHVRIRTYSGTTVTYNYTTMFFFDEAVTNNIFGTVAAYARTTARDTTNATDRVFNGASHNGSPATEAGDYLMLTMGNGGTHINGAFHIVIDLSDKANADPTNGTETSGGVGGFAAPAATTTTARPATTAPATVRNAKVVKKKGK